MRRLILLLIIVATSNCIVMAQSSDLSENYFLKEVLEGNVYFADKQVKIDTLVWNAHPTFKGVYLKHLVVAKDTDNQFSCHIVKIEAGCILDTHIHDGKIELHEVIAGDGLMYLNNKEISYSVGQICVIPANTPHKVVAGKNGLYLFAKFTPAL